MPEDSPVIPRRGSGRRAASSEVERLAADLERAYAELEALRAELDAERAQPR